MAELMGERLVALRDSTMAEMKAEKSAVWKVSTMADS